MWWASDYTPDAYFRYGKNQSKLDCANIHNETLLLKDGEWGLFWSVNSWLAIAHSNLEFRSIEKGWQYVAEHPDQSSSISDGKWVVSIELDKLLGADFFHRRESLLYDARPYMFRALIDVNKIDSTWELQIQGTEDRALVGLDRKFRVVKVAKGSANRK